MSHGEIFTRRLYWVGSHMFDCSSACAQGWTERDCSGLTVRTIICTALLPAQ